MKFLTIKTVVTVVTLVLVAGLDTRPAQAQVDGFANHAIDEGDGWRVKQTIGVTETQVGKPTENNLARKYEIELDAGAWFRFADDATNTKHYVVRVTEFYQLYTDVGLPQNSDAPDPRPGGNPSAPGWEQAPVITNAAQQAWGYKADDTGHSGTATTGSDALFTADAAGQRINAGSLSFLEFNSAIPMSATNRVLFGFHIVWTDTPFEFNNASAPPGTGGNSANVYWDVPGGGTPTPFGVVPEGSSLALMLGGLLPICAGTALFRRRKTQGSQDE